MKKYVFFRIIRSLISIVLVTAVTYTLIFSLVPREKIFDKDGTIQKLSGKKDDLTEYKMNAFEINGYIDFYTTSELCTVAANGDSATYTVCMNGDTTAINNWKNTDGKDWVLQQYPVSQKYYATRDIPLLERLGNFFGNMVFIDNVNYVQDASNPDLERKVEFTNSSSGGFALTCSGCKSKYLLYFDSSFPFIHQNFIKLNFGVSYPAYSGIPVMTVISQRQGSAVSKEIEFDTGKVSNSPVNIHSCTYKNSNTIDRLDQERFVDNYADCNNNLKDNSMIGNSFLTGILSIVIAYGIGIPAGVYMSRKKGKLPDRIGIGIVTVLISVPSLAFIYFFQFLGSTLFKLPTAFPTYGASDFRSYVLPVLILGLLSVSGLIIWVRRYMIDQSNSDYVRFAKAKGLSEGEIFKNHIMRNALIPILNGLPGSIILTITGATITESVFAIPGMGKMLPNAIEGHNNNMIVALVFIFTTLSVLSVLLGDLLMIKVDPRISFSSKGE